MDRRSFFGAAGFALTSASAAATLAEAATVAAAPGKDRGDAQGSFQLNSRYTNESSMAMFTSAAPATALPPLTYLYYDTKAERFINPRNVEPNKPQGKYELNVELMSFHISSESRAQLGDVNQKRDLQLTLNVAAPQSADVSQTLSWVFMNAIDVFGDRKNIQQNLTKFVDNNKLTSSLTPLSKVVIPQGSVELQVVALGQRKDGFWKNFFAAITKLSTSPIFGSFGLPALVPEALQFVNTSLNSLEKSNETLLPIWQTKRLPFGILKDTDADFKLREGYWITVDREYAISNEMLKDHKLDLDGQSFSLVRSDNAATDTNYLVSHFALPASKA